MAKQKDKLDGQSDTGQSSVERSIGDQIGQRETEMAADLGVAPRRVGYVGSRSITAFLRQLLMLVDTGTPLVKGLRTLSERTANWRLRTLIGEVCNYVEAGNPLWQALEQYPKQFSPVFVNLIKAGEASGTITEVLRRLIDFRERSESTRRRVKSALIYPTIVLVAALLFVFAVSKWVVPAFVNMFEEVGIEELPGLTRLVMNVSHVIGAYWLLWVILLVAIWVAYKVFGATPGGRLTVDRIKLRLPGIGRILTAATVAEFTRTFALLLRSGVSILVTLDLTKDAMQNKAFGNSLVAVRDSVERGEGLEAPLRNNALVPPIVADMLVTGEESGTLDEISEKIADIYQDDLEVAVNTLSGLIEPVLAIVMGIVVLILVLTLFLPYIGMIEHISTQGI